MELTCPRSSGLGKLLRRVELLRSSIRLGEASQQSFSVRSVALEQIQVGGLLLLSDTPVCDSRIKERLQLLGFQLSYSLLEIGDRLVLLLQLQRLILQTSDDVCLCRIGKAGDTFDFI